MALEGHLGTLFVDIKARNKMKGEIGRIGNQMRAAGRVMTTYITLPIVAAGAMAVKTAAEFETSMRQIAVATGAPNKELKKMEKLAIKLGADTIYSANEAAEAMLELAKSGITPAQISAGALESTLALAAASGLDMAQSAVVMGTSLNAFHLEAKDSKGAVDALAGAANASSAEVKDIALALQQVSAMAYQSGLSIQETTAVLAAFADSGIRGSDAGTSFKVFLQRLNPVTGRAKEKMEELGLSFYKSNGEMKPLVGIVKELQTKLGGMTQKQRMATMQILFGTDAVRAAAVLYDQGAEGMKKYIKETSAAGSASKMAAARMGGIAGALEQLRGSIETAGLIIGKLLAPSIRAVAGMLKRLFNAFSALPKPVQKMIVLFAALLAAIGPILLVLGLMAAALTVLMSGALLPFLIVLGKIALVIAGVVAAGYLLSKMWKYLRPVLKPVIDAFGTLWDSLKELYNLIKPMLLPVLKVLAGIVGGAILIAFANLAMLLAVVVNVIAGVIKIFVGLGKVIWGVGEILWGFITGNRKLMAKGVKDMTAGFSLMGEGAKNAVVDSALAIYNIIKGTVEGIGGMLGDSMAKTAEEGKKGGKQSGKKYSEGHEKEMEKGRSNRKKQDEKAQEKRAKEEKKHGEESAAAYNEGMEGGLLDTVPRTKEQKAEQEEWEAHLHRRSAYWKAFVEGDFEGAQELMKLAEEHEKKADKLRGDSHKKAEKRQRDHQTKNQGIVKAGGNAVNRLLKEHLNKQSGIFLLSRTRRLALMKAFQEREKFATRNHNDTMAGIFRFFKNKVAGLDRLFNTQANERRKGHQSKQRTGTRIHWTQMITITGFALFGPAGLLGLHLEFGRRVFAWLRSALGRQRGENRRHWNLYKALTRLKLGEIFVMMGTMITNFGTWLRRVPQMLANALTSGANWLYQAGRKLVNRFIKGMKDRIKAALGQGKKTSQSSRKGYKQGTKGNKKAGKKASKDLQKGFKEGGKGAKKSGKGQGKKTGKGFREGANKGQKKGGRTFAQRFIDALKKKLGISSPSKVTKKLGTSTRRGFIQGLDWKAVRKSTKQGLDDSIDVWKEQLRKFQKWLRQRPKEWGRLLKLNAHYMGNAGIFLAKTLIGAVKMRLGIKSPSKQFENIGKQMIMGLIAGLGKKKLLEILSKHFGGWEAFAKHIMTTIQQNVGRGWDWLSEFMGTDAKVLLAALEAHFGVAMEGAGALAGVKLEVGSVEMMRAIAEWLIAQDPDSNSSISSLFRPGDPRQHGRGEAVDIAPGSDKIANLAAKIIGYAGNWGEDTKGGFGVLSTAFGQVLWKTMVGGNHWNHVHLGIKAISDFLRNLATAAPTGTGKVPAGSGHDLGPSAVWDALYSVAVQRWNDPQQMRDLHSLISRESGFDTDADNPNSDAWGLFQLMTNIHAKPGGHLPKGTASSLAEQITGGLNYIAEAHGSPSAAWKFWQNPTRGDPSWGNWYKGGGAVSATLHEGERVLTARQNRWFSALANPLAKVVAGGGMLYNSPISVTAKIPDGTKFRIIDLQDGVLEAVGEGVDYYDYENKRDLRKKYRGQ